MEKFWRVKNAVRAAALVGLGLSGAAANAADAQTTKMQQMADTTGTGNVDGNQEIAPGLNYRPADLPPPRNEYGPFPKKDSGPEVTDPETLRMLPRLPKYGPDGKPMFGPNGELIMNEPGADSTTPDIEKFPMS